MEWITKLIVLGFAAWAVWFMAGIIRQQRTHAALSKRMEQYGEWIKGYKDMSPADKKLAEGYANKLFAGGFDYRGPWEP